MIICPSFLISIYNRMKMVKKRIVLTIFSVVPLLWLLNGCSGEQKIDPECVMQIKDVGLREGVFVRRYKMTGDYGRPKSFNSEILNV